MKSASTVVYAFSARSAVGLKFACTVVYALTARSAAGLKSASTIVYAITARSARNKHLVRDGAYLLEVWKKSKERVDLPKSAPPASSLRRVTTLLALARTSRSRT